MRLPAGPRTLSVLLLSLLAAVLLAGPAQAQGTYPPALTAPTLSSPTPTLGEDVSATAGGFTAGEQVSATAFSTPVPLGTKAADAQGTVTFAVDTDLLGVGSHRIVFTGASGRTVTAAFDVVAASADGAGSLASTGADVGGLAVVGALLVASGAGAVTAVRRRRSTSAV